ncbi:unnamed protein product [[Candida] boidinii]|nr:unnamed protein product [[Candida] boidinii]
MDQRSSFLLLESSLEKVARLNSWLPTTLDVNNDQDVALWIEENHKKLDSHLKKLKGDGVKQRLASLLKSDSKSTIEGITEILSLMPTDEKEKILRALN